jgi:hypothetical protein
MEPDADFLNWEAAATDAARISMIEADARGLSNFCHGLPGSGCERSRDEGMLDRKWIMLARVLFVSDRYTIIV